MATGKMGLKVREVAKDHFSSGKSLPQPKFSRMIVRLLEGKSLLASDVVTGKSDPVCFVWCGGMQDTPSLDVAGEEGSGFVLTKVCPTTTDPIWNEDTIFPLDMSDISALLELRCLIYIRDEDIVDGNTSYDDLGMVQVPFKEILTRGKVCKNSIVLPARWYVVEKSPGMRKVDGKIKLTCSLVFSDEDNVQIAEYLKSSEEYQKCNNAYHAVHDPSSDRNQASVPCQVQKLARYIVDPSGVVFRDTRSVSPNGRGGGANSRDPSPSPSRQRLNGLRSSMGRLSTTSLRSIASNSTSNIAPLVKSPSQRGKKRPGLATAPVAAGSAVGERAYSYDDGVDGDFVLREEPEYESSTVDHGNGEITDRPDAAANDIQEPYIDNPEVNMGATNDDIGDELLVLATVGAGGLGGAGNPTQVKMQRADNAHANKEGTNATNSNGSSEPVAAAGAATNGASAATNGTNGAGASAGGAPGTAPTGAATETGAPTGAGGGAQPQDVLLEDVIQVGVQRITAEMGPQVPEDPAEFSRQFQGTAKMLSSAQGGSTSDLLKKGPTAAAADQGLNDRIIIDPVATTDGTVTVTAAAAATALFDNVKNPESVPEIKSSPDLPLEIAAGTAPASSSSAAVPATAGEVTIPLETEPLDEVGAAGASSTVAVVRALREMAQQRQSMQQSLEAIAKVTQSGFAKLSNRISHMEAAMANQNYYDDDDNYDNDQNYYRNDSEREVGGAYVGEEGVPFEEMFPSDEDQEYQEDQDYESNARGRSRSRTSSRQPGNKGSKQGKSSTDRSGSASGRKQYDSRNRKKYSTTPSSSAAASASAPSSSSKSRQPSAPAAARSSKTKDKKFGSIDAIAKAKAQAAAARRVRNSNQQQHHPYGQGPDSTDFQMVMKDAQGNVSGVPVDPPPGSPGSVDGGGGSQTSEVIRNTQFNSSIPVTTPSSPLAPPQLQSPLAASNTMESPKPQLQLNTGSPYGNIPYGSPYGSSGYYPAAAMPATAVGSFPGIADANQQQAAPTLRLNHALNRDFGAILEQGGLDDIGNMLSNTAPKPEELSAMVRNRLYEAVATLLHQRHPQHTERCLIWTLALVRGGSAAAPPELQGQGSNRYKSNSSGRLIQELSGHTKKDLRDALVSLGQEPSKRGLLAALLKSQLK